MVKTCFFLNQPRKRAKNIRRENNYVNILDKSIESKRLLNATKVYRTARR